MRTVIISTSTNTRTTKQKEAFKFIYQTRGMKGFYAGMSMTILKGFLVNSIVMPTLEISHMLMDQYATEEKSNTDRKKKEKKEEEETKDNKPDTKPDNKQDN